MGGLLTTIPRSPINWKCRAVPCGHPDPDELAAEARRLAAEVVAARREIRAGCRPDPAVMSRLSHCYDRLDDIAEAIGRSRVEQIYAAAASAAAPQ